MNKVIAKIMNKGVNANKTWVTPEVIEKSMKKYKIVALIGKAGSGKDTIMKKVLDRAPHLHEIVSCTTRPPRDNEINGVNYHFMTPETFGEKVLQGEMLEASCFNDWFYGTGYESLRSDCFNIGVFNPEGIESLLAHPGVDVDVYHVHATDKNRLLRQLMREANPNVDEIIRRYKADMIDFEDLDFKHYNLPNNTEEDLEFSINLLCSMYSASKLDPALRMPRTN